MASAASAARCSILWLWYRLHEYPSSSFSPLSLSLSLWFDPRASLLIFLYRSNSSLSALSFVRCCCVCPRRTYARTIIRALRASTCTFTQIPHTRALRVYTERAETREREREAYTCTRTYCYVHAYNISASTGGIACARACHRPVANERTWAWSWVRSGTCGERRVGAKGNGARVCVALAWDGRVCIYINT